MRKHWILFGAGICFALTVLFGLTGTWLFAGPKTYQSVAANLDVSGINEIEYVRLPVLARGLSRGGFVTVDRRDDESTLIVFEHMVSRGRNFSGYVCIVPRDKDFDGDMYFHSAGLRGPTVPRESRGEWYDVEADLTPTDTPFVFEANDWMD